MDVSIVPDGANHFTIRTDVIVSPQFFAWLLGLGNRATILEPSNVVNDMLTYLKNIEKNYT